MILGSSGPERNPASCPAAAEAACTSADTGNPVTGGAEDLRTTALACVPQYSLENLLQALHEFVMIVDGDGFVRTAWSSRPRHGNEPEVSLLGCRLSDILDPPAYEEITQISRRTASEGRSQITERVVELADGPRWFAVRALPVGDAAGRGSGLWVLALDISHRQKALDELQKSEALLAQAEELASLGSFDVNIETGEIRWSAQLYRAFQLDPATTHLTREFVWQLVHPEDRERVSRDGGEAYSSRPYPFEHEARWIRADGKVRIFSTRGVPVLDASGRVVRVVGISQDITERKEAEDRLRRSEALLAQAEELANFGSWEFDIRTKRVILSKQLLKLLGIASEAEWTENLHWDNVHPNDRQRNRDSRDAGIAECKPYEYVTRYYTQDSGARFYSVRGVPIAGPDGKSERVIGFLQDITDRAQAEEELRRLSQELMRANDEGRRHTARELHESAGQSLAALKMTLGRLRDSLPVRNDLAHELLRSAIELADGAIREVRTVSYLMHPPLLDEAGLAPALRWFAKGFAERSGIKVDVEVPDDFGRASQEIETTVFRIVQEALTNVHRYSGSPTAKIRLAREGAEIRAEVRDEGSGLPIEGSARGVPPPTGVGIAGIRERVKQLNGVFEMESAPGCGTTIRAILPVEPQQLKHRAVPPQTARDDEEKQRGKGQRAIG